jgi:response regulator RpfG family c-di-GMP phosphodiesterase
MYAAGVYVLVAVDQNMPGMSGLDVLRHLSSAGHVPPTIMVTGAGSEQIAVAAMKLGASDYIVKDVAGGYLELLPLVIERAMRRQQLLEEKQQAEAALRESHALLEQRVAARTAELAKANQALQAEIAERKQAEEQRRRQLRHLSALRRIDMAITASLDLSLTLGVLLDQVTTHLQVDAATVLLLNPLTHTLRYVADRGLHLPANRQVTLAPGEGLAGRVVLEQRMLSIADLHQAVDLPERQSRFSQEEFLAYYGVPLIARGQVQGVLELFHRTQLTPDQEWFDFLETLAGQAAIAIDNADLFDSLQRTHNELILAYDATIEGWARALELRDADTEGHTRRVTDLTLVLAQQMGFQDAELVHLRRGAILHDIGKLAIPDKILLKPGPLTDAEWAIMRQHPVYAAQLITPIPFLRPALEIPLYHHEKWDGTGYPYGLKAEGIPLAARIFAVIDVWDALCSERPYHRAWPVAEVGAHIREQAGGHFDPQVVAAFLHLQMGEEI